MNNYQITVAQGFDALEMWIHRIGSIGNILDGLDYR